MTKHNRFDSSNASDLQCEGPDLRPLEKSKNHPKYVNDYGLAEALCVSVHTIRKWRCEGRIKPYQFGRSVRYIVDEVVATLTKKRKK